MRSNQSAPSRHCRRAGSESAKCTRRAHASIADGIALIKQLLGTRKVAMPELVRALEATGKCPWANAQPSLHGLRTAGSLGRHGIRSATVGRVTWLWVEGESTP